MSHPQTGSGSTRISAGRQANRRARELVGRERELAMLEQLLEAVRSGGSGTLFVHGDPTHSGSIPKRGRRLRSSLAD